MVRKTKNYGSAPILILGMLSLLILAACTSTQSESSIDPVQTALDAGAPTKEVTVDAVHYAFAPEVITVQEGDVVRLTLNSIDLSHGLYISAFNINVAADAGFSDTVEFVANKKGEFPFYCSVYCGVGHADMSGLLIVE